MGKKLDFWRLCRRIEVGFYAVGAVSVASAWSNPTPTGLAVAILLLTFGVVGVGLYVLPAKQKFSEEQDDLRSKVSMDALTGLGNRDAFYREIENYSEQSLGGPYCVFIMDLNGFKEINDTLGHPAGDKILQQVARRLKQMMRISDTVIRLGGDEFAVFFPGMADEAPALRVATKIAEAFDEPFEIEHDRDIYHLNVGVSIGIAFYPEHGHDRDVVIKHADIAMYASKSGGDRFTVYHEALNDKDIAKLTLISDIRCAIVNGFEGLHLKYQPKMRIGDNKIVGVEALLRWDHPESGDVSPAMFIPLVERTELINHLTHHVVEQAIAQVAEWNARGIKLTMSINISAKNLNHMEIIGVTSRALQRHKVDPSDIMFEVTETSIMKDQEASLKVLALLNMLGVRLSIDDFGTGTSSYIYLRHLPIKEIKIDKSFVFEMIHNEYNRHITKSIIELAHVLGCIATAEGVETDEMMAALREMGCDMAQGWLIARPLNPEDVEKLIGEDSQCLA